MAPLIDPATFEGAPPGCSSRDRCSKSVSTETLIRESRRLAAIIKGENMWWFDVGLFALFPVLDAARWVVFGHEARRIFQPQRRLERHDADAGHDRH